MSYSVLLLTGPSCCGKKQIGLFLSKIFQIPSQSYLEMGDLLRKLLKQQHQPEFAHEFQTTYGESPDHPLTDLITRYQFETQWNQHHHQAESFLKKTSNDMQLIDWINFCVGQGHLVPNFITYGTIEKGLQTAIQNKLILIDGYPRTIEAAQDLTEKFKQLDIRLIKCLHFFIDPNTMLMRAQDRGRLDDHQKALLERYQFYLHSVLPTISWIKKTYGSSIVNLIDADYPDCSPNESIANTLTKVLAILEKDTDLKKTNLTC